jgi:hypothetical protein
MLFVLWLIAIILFIGFLPQILCLVILAGWALWRLCLVALFLSASAVLVASIPTLIHATDAIDPVIRNTLMVFFVAAWGVYILYEHPKETASTIATLSPPSQSLPWVELTARDAAHHEP